MGQAKTNRVWRSGISVVLFTGLAVAPFLTAKAQTQEDDVGIRGLVRSKHKVEIRSAMSARLLHAPFRDGMRFKAGDLLLAFDCRVPKARLAGAEAEQEAESYNTEQYSNDEGEDQVKHETAEDVGNTVEEEENYLNDEGNYINEQDINVVDQDEEGGLEEAMVEPGIAVNSCTTPSTVTDVTAVPSMDESSTRRSPFPMV